MTGAGLLGLILLSMAWLFFLGGMAVNVQALRARLKGKSARGLGFVPGVVGSLTVFFTIPALYRHGIDVPWPWLWILLPLFVDPFCLGAFVLLALQRLTRG
jgi:hypothetical protein